MQPPVTMTTPEDKSRSGDGDVKPVLDVGVGRRRIGFTISSMANTPYRQLQLIAKMCNVPCNLKKGDLKMVIKAKMNGQYDEVAILLNKVREERFLRKKQKALEKSNKTPVKTEFLEENNNEMKPKEDQETVKKVEEMLQINKVKDVLQKRLVKMTSARNVTIKKTSTETHYRALVAPGNWRFNKCLDAACCSSSPSTTQSHETLNNSSVIKYAVSKTASSVVNQGQCQGISTTASAAANHYCSQASSSTAIATVHVEANQCNIPQIGDYEATREQSYTPAPAGNNLDTLMQHYERKPVSYNQTNKNTKSWTGCPFNFHPKVIAASYQPLQNCHSLPYNNQHSKDYQRYDGNQTYNTGPQTNEMECGQSKPIFNLYKANQQCERSSSSYEGFQYGIQRSSSLFNMGSAFVEPHSSNNVTFTNVESYAGIQPAYASFNRNPINNVPNQTPTDDIIPGELSTNASEDSKSTTDLGLLANMAVTKTQEFINENRSQQYKNSLLMINEANNHQPCGKEEPISLENIPLLQNFPALNNIFERMSNNLSPALTNEVIANCKYGCHIPMSNKQQQLRHEEHCILQPIQCPLDPCKYVGQLRSTSSHILNVHSNCTVWNGSGSFHIDFTDGMCSFEYPRAWLRNCPKKLCYFQLVDGRLFAINVIGNFDAMQVLIYVQYVNDYYSWKSRVACEVVRHDGLPLQFTGEALPMTYSTLHMISRRNCFIFNMNSVDWSRNTYMLHTKIENYM